MPQPLQAKGTGDGGHEGDEVDGNKRAKARASSKEKSKAAKAAKKQKTSASACQVRRERNTAGANVTRTGCQPAQRNSQHLTWLRMIRTGGIVREKDFGV